MDEPQYSTLMEALSAVPDPRVQARVVRKGEPPLVVLRWCLQELRT